MLDARDELDDDPRRQIVGQVVRDAVAKISDHPDALARDHDEPVGDGFAVDRDGVEAFPDLERDDLVGDLEIAPSTLVEDLDSGAPEDERAMVRVLERCLAVDPAVDPNVGGAARPGKLDRLGHGDTRSGGQETPDALAGAKRAKGRGGSDERGSAGDDGQESVHGRDDRMRSAGDPVLVTAARCATPAEAALEAAPGARAAGMERPGETYPTRGL
jgi:hypothetical protein